MKTKNKMDRQNFSFLLIAGGRKTNITTKMNSLMVKMSICVKKKLLSHIPIQKHIPSHGRSRGVDKDFSPPKMKNFDPLFLPIFPIEYFLYNFFLKNERKSIIPGFLLTTITLRSRDGASITS